ncbi:MAG: glycosyltransferase family 2 protein [Terrimicrobiaceae bacterium]
MNTQPSKPTISVVVPCYQEEAVFPILLDRLLSVLNGSGRSFELIFVNDGSSDGTWGLIMQACESNPEVAGIDLSRNYGHQIALTAGLQYCTGERIFVIDADLQDPPELFYEMDKVMTASCADVVYGKRISREGESWFKVWTATGFYKTLSWLSDVHIPRDTGDFRLMSRKALDAFLSMTEKNRFVRGMVSWVGFRQVAFEYVREKRLAGSTRYTLQKMVRLALDAITSFSVKPLRLATYVGLAIATCSVLGILYVILMVVSGRWETVKGWPSIVVVMLLLSSIQLIVVGITGEYVGRIFIEVKGRPLFFAQNIVHRRLNLRDGADTGKPLPRS